MCGGTGSSATDNGARKGLSPRVRGNPHHAVRWWCIWRSIPACAGEPTRLARYSSFSGVYPRVCGGTTVAVPEQVAVPGLSPRVRGNPGKILRCSVDVGSIPACAGEPFPSSRACRVLRVYPRVCGGTQVKDADGLEALGFPACAGEPPPAAGGRRIGRVYPRVCGGTVHEGLLESGP